MYEGNPNILTAADIEEVHANGASAIALPDGRDAIPVLLVLSPDCGKVYGTGPGVSPMPAQLHLTNGMWHKLLDIAPMPTDAPSQVAASDAAAEPAADNHLWMMTDAGPAPFQSPDAEAAEPVAGAEESADDASAE